MKNKYYNFLLIIPLLYFLFMSLSGVQTLGINVDEGDVGLISSDFLSQFKADKYLVRKAHYTFLNGNSASFAVSAFDIKWPLMLHSYEGILSIYPSVIMLAFDVNPALSLRLPHILFGFFSLILAYLIFQKAFSKAVALLTVLFLSINPVFIASARIGHFADEILQIFIFLTALYLLQKFVLNGRFRYLYMAFFICGIGVSAKFMFFGYIAGMVCIMLFIRKYRILFFKKQVLFYGSILFLLGVLPVILQNIACSFDPFISFAESLFTKNRSGYDNLQIFSNLLIRLEDLMNFVLQNMHTFLFLEDKAHLNNYASFFLFVGSLFFIICSKDKTIKLFVLGYGVLFFLTVFVPFEYDEMHMVILFPIVELMQAKFICYFWDTRKKHKVFAFLLMTVCIIYVLKSNSSNIEIRKRILTNDVREEWSTLIYPFSDYLLKNNIKEVMTIKPLLSGTPISYLTRRKVKVVNFWDHAKSKMEEFGSWCKESIKYKKDNIYFALLGPADSDALDDYGFFDMLRKEGYNISLTKSFKTDYDKIEIYLIAAR